MIQQSVYLFKVLRLKKAIISCLLVLTYSIGFTHNLVPHCSGEIDHVDVLSEDVHHHNHHEHNDKDASDHNHVVHNNHFDSNYVDLVICLLEDVGQEAEHCGQEHCFVISSKVLSLKNLPSTQLTYVLYSLFQNITELESPSHYDVEICCNYLSPPLERSPHRGPPFTLLS